MGFISIFFTLLAVIITLIYLLYKQKMYSWKRKNVETYSLRELTKNAKTRHIGLIFADVYQMLYNEQKPYIIVESLLNSTLIVQDLNVIKDIAITNFDSFPDRGLYTNHNDPLSYNLVRLNYDLWRPLRQKLTPTFSVAKMKYMFPTLLKVGEQFTQLLAEKCERNEEVMEIRELCARFTTDIIGNVAFGIECNSLKDPNTEFIKHTNMNNANVNFNLIPIIDNLGYRYPKLFDFFNVRPHSKKMSEFFSRIVKETIEYREKHHLRYNDFMDILLELKNNDQEKFVLTVDMIVAQAFVFFLAGSESTSSTMSYALYELAKNQETQDKTRADIMEVLKNCNDAISYDNLQNMTYLKQVVQETLRKYPIFPVAPRVCSKPFTIKTAKHSLTIEPGTTITLPIYGIHHNPAYYCDPESFKPERFDENEVAKRLPLSYIPFGVGPRICIGERFARMQTQMGLALLLSQFRFSVTEKTPEVLEFNPENIFGISLKDGINLRLEKL